MLLQQPTEGSEEHLQLCAAVLPDILVGDIEVQGCSMSPASSAVKVGR